MQVEFRVNGTMSIVLKPEEPLHRVILDAMTVQSEKGVAFKMLSDEDGNYTIISTRA